jgi:hypothetical protein
MQSLKTTKIDFVHMGRHDRKAEQFLTNNERPATYGKLVIRLEMGAEGGITATRHTSTGTTRTGGKDIENHYRR